LIADPLQKVLDAGAGFVKIAIFVGIELFVFQGFQERFAGHIVVWVSLGSC